MGSWQADTIFGALCWAMVDKCGRATVEKFCDQYNGSPPLILSNLFPEDLFPCPWFPTEQYRDRLGKEERIKEFMMRKEKKENIYCTLEEFNSLIQGDNVVPSKANPIVEKDTYKNQINRLFGSTADPGTLYREIQWFYDKPLVIYMKIDSDWLDVIFECIKLVAVRGIGKKSSAGNGSFKIQSFDEYKDFIEVSDPNSFVSLSNFVPARNDPTRGYYDIFTKYSKHGGYLASGSAPFKKPLLMLKAGAWFKTNKPVRQYYGRMLRGLSLVQPDNLHYGLAFAVSMYRGISDAEKN